MVLPTMLGNNHFVPEEVLQSHQKLHQVVNEDAAAKSETWVLWMASGSSVLHIVLPVNM